MHPFQIIGGRYELEKTFQRLLSAPESFTQDEFEHLVDVTFKDRLSRAEAVDLMERQLRNGQDEDPLEARTLLAIMEGDHDEVARLFGVLERRNSLGLRVIQTRKSPTSR